MTRELTMKQWRLAEAARWGVGEHAIAMRLKRGQYPLLKVRRVNKRIVFVEVNGAWK